MIVQCLRKTPEDGILTPPLRKGAAGMRGTPADAIAALRKEHGSLSEVARQVDMNRTTVWLILDGSTDPAWDRGEDLRKAAGFAAAPMTPAQAVGRLLDHMTWRAAASFVGAQTDAYVDASYLQKIRKETVIPRWSLGNLLVELAERMK